ncbi:MAG: hypothetical protein EOP34_09445 [Rickettsiales bacterium]|nr:MAG: hypothetical protein EOP34_09445 [Rickettsiales bacterium]
MNKDKLISNVPFVNLALTIISNILIFSTWFKLLHQDIDTMFLGLFELALLLLTVYYWILLNWSIKLVKNRNNSDKTSLVKNLGLLLLNMIPITLIYSYTT